MLDNTPAVLPELPPPPPEKRVWGAWPTAGLGAVIMFILLLVMVFVVVIMVVALAIPHLITGFDEQALREFLDAYLGLVVSVAGIIAYAAGTGLVIAFARARGRAGIAEYLGFRRISWKAAGAAVLITAAVVALTTLIGNFIQESGDDSLFTDLYKSSVWPPLLWILVVVFAPIFEETMFRGFLFEGFRNSRLGVIGAVVLTSFTWMLFHIGYSFYSLAAIFIFGLVLGVVRYKTGSSWGTMLMHACYNLVGMTLIAMSAAG
jgi:uncharacterized protein